MTQDELRETLNCRVGGLWMAAMVLVKLMDHPQINLHELRESKPARIFREQARMMNQYMMDFINTLPRDALPPEEKKFLELWFKEVGK